MLCVVYSIVRTLSAFFSPPSLPLISINTVSHSVLHSPLLLSGDVDGENHFMNSGEVSTFYYLCLLFSFLFPKTSVLLFNILFTNDDDILNIIIIQISDSFYLLRLIF